MKNSLILWVKYSGQKWGNGEGGYNVDSKENAIDMIVEKFNADNLVFLITDENRNIVVDARKIKNLVKKKHGGKFNRELLY